MSRIDDELDRGAEHELKRIVKQGPTGGFNTPTFYAECWCGDRGFLAETKAEAHRQHDDHQREERGW